MPLPALTPPGRRPKTRRKLSFSNSVKVTSIEYGTTREVPLESPAPGGEPNGEPSAATFSETGTPAPRGAALIDARRGSRRRDWSRYEPADDSQYGPRP